MEVTVHQHIEHHKNKQSGQVMIITVLALSFFLLGAAAFGVDVANLWYHRQAAQTAADAACTAGAMDLLYDAEGEPTPSSASWSWIGKNNVDCNTHYSGATTYAPCWYAAQNGYGSGVGTVVLNYPTAPTSASGLSTCSSTSGVACLAGYVANSLLQVNVTDAVRVFFMGMINGSKTVKVGAKAVCGVVAVQSPVPILVLDPRDETSVTIKGTPTIAIYGGPSRSVQVNASSTSAVSISGASNKINLCQGGANATGSFMAITGDQTSVSDLETHGFGTCPVGEGTTGGLNAPAGPISDPFATVCAPGETTDCQTTINGNSAPAIPTNSIGNTGSGNVNPGVDGCPLAPSHGGTCEHFVPGLYSSGIDVKNSDAVFDPGLYYVSTKGLTLDSNSNVCPGTGVSPYQGDGSQGAVFYFANGDSTSVVANSGSDQCTNSSGTSLTAGDIVCSTGEGLPSNLTTTTVLAGNVLLAPCSGYYGDPLGTSDPSGEQRGFLFFQYRGAMITGGGAQWGGGGSFSLAGTMYFHYCDNSTVPASGEFCDSTNGYMDLLTLSGSSGAGTYILGDIETDQLEMNGTPAITMDLSSTAAYYILKATLLQ
jgi:hypothetical protein